MLHYMEQAMRPEPSSKAAGLTFANVSRRNVLKAGAAGFAVAAYNAMLVAAKSIAAGKKNHEVTAAVDGNGRSFLVAGRQRVDLKLRGDRSAVGPRSIQSIRPDLRRAFDRRLRFRLQRSRCGRPSS